MKPRLLSALILASTIPALPLAAHGPGHSHAVGRPEVDAEMGRMEGGAESPSSTSPASTGKNVARLEESRWWGASLAAGWESRHVHYGVDETGATGAYTTELSLTIQGLTLSVWSGFGTGTDFQEWDFTASYTFELGPVFLIPGYNFRYTPSFAHTEEHDHHHEEDHDHHGHDDHDHHHHHSDHHSHGHAHTHRTYGHEIFLVAGTTAIPYVTPTMMVLSDLANTPGTLLQFRLDGGIPAVKNTLILNPYALLAVNLGYNSNDTMGWNNFQFGAEAELRLNRHVSLFGGVNYSIAMYALRELGQDNVFWANGGVRLTY